MRTMASKALADVKMEPFWLDRPDRPETLPPLANARKADLLVVGGGFMAWARLRPVVVPDDFDPGDHPPAHH